MRNSTEIQRWLIAQNYLAAVDDNGRPNDDGVFGTVSLAAYNRARAAKGLKPHEGILTLTEINAVLFPEEQPPAPTNPLKDWLMGLAIKQAVSHLKGLPQMEFLSGFKTYILAALILVSAAAETFVPGLDIPGFSMSIGEAIMVSLALVTGRSGAKTDVKKAIG